MSENASVNRDRLVSIGLIIIILLIVSALVISLYQTFSNDVTKLNEKSELNNFFKNPQVISIAVGLIISILFIDRWRSLESKVDNLSKDQQQKLNSIEKYTNQHIELKIGQVIGKADSLNAQLASITKKHPWLEVITERDIIVESDSIRGILRSSYILLKAGKWLHLYEYLEYCSRKGTSFDTRDPKTNLIGTADDFVEISKFCEIWLEDFALSSEFVKRYIESSESSSLLPLHIKQLLRIGKINEAKHQSLKLRKIIYGNNLYSTCIRLLGLKELTSQRFMWEASNVLSIAYKAFGEHSLSRKFHENALESYYSKLFCLKQCFFDIELYIEQGNFDKARELINNVNMTEVGVNELSELIHLLSKIGDSEGAATLRSQLVDERSKFLSFINNSFEDKVRDKKKRSNNSDYRKSINNKYQKRGQEVIFETNISNTSINKEPSDRSNNKDEGRLV